MTTEGKCMCAAEVKVAETAERPTTRGVCACGTACSCGANCRCTPDARCSATCNCG